MSSPGSEARRTEALRENRRLRQQSTEEKRLRARLLLAEGLPLAVIAERLRVSRSFVASVRGSR